LVSGNTGRYFFVASGPAAVQVQQAVLTVAAPR